MKKLHTHGFKIGDMVYAHKRGMKPMKVISVDTEGISCEHPHGFKIGDMVYAHKNSLWVRFGMKPMKVISVGREGIGCEHPDSPGVCWFYASECQLVTRGRKLALAKLQAKLDEIDRLKKSLFKD